MSNTFIISDTHFTHESMLRFKNNEGELIRPGFSSVEEMDEYMVEKWNSTVQPNDTIYHLGDVALRRSQIRIVERLNGKKKLIRGNHDIEKAKFYLKFFDDVLAVKVFPKHNMIFSHYPIHPGSLWAWKAGKWKINVHGHTHFNKVTMLKKRFNGAYDEFYPVEDPRYINMCVEHHDYTPMSFEDLMILVENRREIATSIPVEKH